MSSYTPVRLPTLAADGSAGDTGGAHRRSGDLPLRLRGTFEQHVAFVYRCLRRLGVPESELDDALERVFVRVDRHLIERGERPTRGWLYAECKRAAPASARESRPLELGAAQDREGLGFGQLLLALLPAEQREVFILYEVEDLPLPEIALALDRSERSARALLLEARALVVAEVERRAAEASDV